MCFAETEHFRFSASHLGPLIPDEGSPLLRSSERREGHPAAARSDPPHPPASFRKQGKLPENLRPSPKADSAQWVPTGKLCQSSSRDCWVKLGGLEKTPFRSYPPPRFPSQGAPLTKDVQEGRDGLPRATALALLPALRGRQRHPLPIGYRESSTCNSPLSNSSKLDWH